MGNNFDANFNPEAFRANFPIVIACNRHHATILPVRMRFLGAGLEYPFGQTIARNTVDGLYDKYVSGGASGTGTAAAFLLYGSDFASVGATGGSQAMAAIFGGEVYSTALKDFGNSAPTDLKARTVVDATGTSIVIF